MVLGYFDVSGRPFERVKYSPLDSMMRRIASKNYTSAMRIFVIDETGSIINFNGHPLRFKVEAIECLHVIKCHQKMSSRALHHFTLIYLEMQGTSG